MNYFNSDNHVRQQCAKIERMMNRKINPIKVKEMNNYLLSIYYPIKPKNISDEVFLRKLSIKSIYDVCEKVIEEQKRKGKPIKSILVNNQRNTTQGIGVNGEKINMSYQRAPMLNQNKEPLQNINYQSMLKELNVQDVNKPDETEIMKHIKENQSSWQNTGKNKDNNLQTPMQPQTPPQSQPPQQNQQPQINQQQNNNFAPASNGDDLNSFNNLFNSGSLLDGISEADKEKFNNASGPVQAPVYQEINIKQGPPPQSLQ